MGRQADFYDRYTGRVESLQASERARLLEEAKSGKVVACENNVLTSNVQLCGYYAAVLAGCELTCRTVLLLEVRTI